MADLTDKTNSMLYRGAQWLVEKVESNRRLVWIAGVATLILGGAYITATSPHSDMQSTYGGIITGAGGALGGWTLKDILR